MFFCLLKKLTESIGEPIDIIKTDAAILFSDILTIPDAMGLGLSFVEGEGPRFARPIRSHADIEKLFVPDMAKELRYVMDAVSLIRKELNDSVPLIGFSGSPWTLACYMIEGGGSDNFAKIKAMALNDAPALHRLLAIVTDSVIAYLSAQRAAGAQALQVFDTWGGVLSPHMYREFSLRYLQRIAAELPRGEGARANVRPPVTDCSSSGVMHCFLDRIATSAARDNSSLMCPVMPLVALMIALTMARLAEIRDACRSGSCRSNPARNPRKSSFSCHRGSSNPGNRLAIWASVCIAASASRVPSTTIAHFS